MNLRRHGEMWKVLGTDGDVKNDGTILFMQEILKKS